ncbi:hypothetical protein CONLIGDRAFT_632143 [Coniochaeta ligniaria NRRL 30616]|uniref:BTB domain-containing protein n=1 Tax=Coniochaeta ligniaria NRRL 30616 TaxID=1408157 RepID=A0A1J7JJM4_9PEZI|nr:hypothetical protein CONLIGDRAFT_632143 [Coniochaeta ligniaria NRRL 30616]
MGLFGEPKASTPTVGDLVPGNTKTPDLIIFEEDGDLRLEVGPERMPMIVCPKALARASPVFKRILFGGFAESKPADGE